MAQDRRALAGLALGLLFVFALVAARIPRHGFVTVDLGAIYLQVTGLAVRGSAAIPVGPLLAPVAKAYWPWRYESTPPGPLEGWERLRGGWLAERDGRMLVIYPIGFAAPAALISRVIGEPGSLVLPVLAGALVCWATGLLGLRMGLARPAWAAWLAGLASPVSLYAVLTWGHAPAVAAAAVGWLLLAPGRGPLASAGAGFAFGLAGAFRNEGMLLTAIVAALLPFFGPAPRFRHTLAFLCGAALALAGPFLYNRVNFGGVLDPTQASRTAGLASAAPAPAPDAAARLALRARQALGTLAESLLQSDNLGARAGAIWGGAVLLAIVLLIAGLARAGLALASLCAALYVFFAAHMAPQQVPGLLVCAPALIPGVAALLSPRTWWSDLRLHVLAAAAFVATCALRGSPGWQWGGRYFLPALPVFAVLSIRAFERLESEPKRRAATRLALALLLTASTAMSVIGWRDLASEQAFREHEQRAVRETAASAVAFDHWWFSWNNAPLSADHELFFTKTPADLTALCDHLARANVTRLALVTRVPSNTLETWTRPAAAHGWRCTGEWNGVLPFGHPWHVLAFER